MWNPRSNDSESYLFYCPISELLFFYPREIVYDLTLSLSQTTVGYNLLTNQPKRKSPGTCPISILSKKKKKKWKIHLTPGYQSTNKKEGRVRKIPRKRKWPLIPVFLPGKFHGQRSLAGYSSWGHTKLGTAEATKHNKKYKMTSFSWLYLFRLYCIIYLFKRYYISFNHP